MAGTKNSGRRKSITVRTLQAVGKPRKLRGLNVEQSAMWDRIVAAHAETSTLGAVDAEMVLHCCRMWELLQTCTKRFQADPTDRAARMAFQSVAGAWRDAMNALALTPAGRCKLELPAAPADDATALSVFAGGRA